MAPRSSRARVRMGKGEATAVGKGTRSETGGEFRSGPIAGTAIIPGVTFARRSLPYAVVEGLAIFEGDIVLGTEEEVTAVRDRAIRDAGAGNLPQSGVIITGQQFRWPNCTIPFDIDPALPNQQRITDAIAHWEANTQIRLVLRTAANAAQYPDFVHFQSGGGCSSMVGRRGGQQNITLEAGCTAGNAIHEIGHAVGLWHEQSREDRDTFVQIVWANIDPAMQFNFDQHIADGDDIGAYDYCSIMHYPPTAFSINGLATIIALQPLPPGCVMGQRNGLSQGDINAVNAMYPFCGVTIKEVRKDPLKEIRKDPITDPTLKEIRKDPITDPTLKEIRKDPITDPTLKEIRKDPITDPTLKEVRKDVVADPTIKEVGQDPLPTLAETVTVPGQTGIGQGPSPFILAGASRAAGEPAYVLAEAEAQVQQLAEALALLEQQQAELMVAYDEAVQALSNMQQGQGS